MKNKDIVKWIGWDDLVLVPSFHRWIDPEFVANDSECIELFAILRKRGYRFNLYFENLVSDGCYKFVIVLPDGTSDIGRGNTIGSSILMSIFSHIERVVN